MFYAYRICINTSGSYRSTIFCIKFLKFIKQLVITLLFLYTISCKNTALVADRMWYLIQAFTTLALASLPFGLLTKSINWNATYWSILEWPYRILEFSQTISNNYLSMLANCKYDNTILNPVLGQLKQKAKQACRLILLSLERNVGCVMPFCFKKA